jgi:hypothetical protein
MSTVCNRRAFFGTLTGLATLTSVAAQDKPPAWDLSWMDGFKGKHKQVFDFGSTAIDDDPPLRLANNYLNTFRDVFHVEPPEVNVAVGIAGRAFPINASDALWQKYPLGELWKVTDEETGKPATRNIFLGRASAGPAATVSSLTARGVVFWQCNIALGGVASQLARHSGLPVDKVRAEVVAGLNPGVRIVPAHSMAVGLAQEHGFSYMRP